MTVLSTLGPLLLALLMGYWINVSLLTPSRVSTLLSQLTYVILALIGFSLGALDDFSEKLLTAGRQAVLFLIMICLVSLTALFFSGRYLSSKEDKSITQSPLSTTDTSTVLSWAILHEAGKTLAWVVAGGILGYVFSSFSTHIDSLVMLLLYVLLFLIGCQLRQGNYRLRKLFLNSQGLIIASVTIFSTLMAGVITAFIIGLPWQHGLAVVSGFGWYSLSGILITGLGNPVLGTTAFLLDLSREILALMLIPIFAKINTHLSIGFSGATAMDFTLPMLSKFHSSNVIPICIASGFIMSLLTPILIPLFLEMSFK
ncbi:lysine exporter LysO family protein [Marinomonas sp. 15G1-11]|uniref:Lysine exporter LysO family protein n=1 Tax=Marinomonas phaeophyticola TaxID=3004091 RepID=A0ABT4JRJ1_9GAMM|nr:lysine exporter LysO family protein [Marinomonas sp. 15G1-11]MCZ2721000.1 lysine exporter LysO family protein [Marinomonas sp. 15G1-11]